MRLVLKLPSGKPPFIGVEFENASKGERENKDLLLTKRNAVYKLLFEPTCGLLNIRLYSENPPVVRYYKGIDFNPDAFKRWLHTAELYKKVNFGHTYSEKANDTICSLFDDGKKVPFVLKVDWLMVDDS